MWHLHPSSCLATADVGRNLGGCAHWGEVELGPHLTQSCPGRGLPSYQVASCSIQQLGHNRYGPKIEDCVPFLGEGSWVPSSTMWPVPRPTSILSGILIHAAVLAQETLPKPFAGGGPGSPSNTMWPGPRPTCVPSFILIRPTGDHNTPTL